MNFVKQMPNVKGWIWYVDTEWACPQIGFIGPFRKFYNLKMDEIPERYLDSNIRFGEAIPEPQVGEIE